MVNHRFFDSRTLVIGIVLIAFSSISPHSRATSIRWRNPAGGAYNAAGNWFGSVVPGASDIAVFGLTTNTASPPFPTPTTYTISFAATTTNQGISVDDDQVTLDLNGFIYRTPGATNVVGNTHNQTGRLTIIDGTWDDNLSGSLQINPKGSLTVSTGGSFLGESINVAGSGGLLVNNGGQVVSPSLVIGTLSLNNSTALATVDGANSSLTVGHLGLGISNAAVLEISAGGIVENQDDVILGVSTDVPATVTIGGFNSRWISPGTVAIGFNGPGTLNITAGGEAQLGDTNIGAGAVNVLAAAGAAMVAGVNALLTTTNLEVGPLAEGTLSITDRGLVQNTGTVLNIGKNGLGIVNINSGGRLEAVDSTLGGITGEGIVTVTGIGSEWINTGTLSIAEFGQGTLNIADGALVQNGNCVVGVGVPIDALAGTVVVDGVGSLWRNIGALTIGKERAGNLTITNGAKVTSVLGFVGNDHLDHGTIIGHGVGTVTVAGPGSEWDVSSVLIIGNRGTGVMNVSQDAIVRSSDGFVGDAGTGDGAVHLDHAQWICSPGPIRVGFGGTGVLTMANDASVQAPALIVGQFGVLSGAGSIVGNLTNSGLVAPGDEAIGAFHVTGAFAQQPGGVLEIDLGGNTAAHADFLDVGAATLAGILKLQSIPGSILPTNTVLSATSLTGQFSNVASGQRLSLVNGGGSFLVFYGPGSPFNPNDIVLTSFLPSLLAGDFDQDGDVDGTDFLLWQRGGSPMPNSPEDLATWQADFGLSVSTSVASAVPEPATLALVGLASARLRLNRRLRRTCPSIR